jgi:hypothetical protein
MSAVSSVCQTMFLKYLGCGTSTLSANKKAREKRFAVGKRNGPGDHFERRTPERKRGQRPGHPSYWRSEDRKHALSMFSAIPPCPPIKSPVLVGLFIMFLCLLSRDRHNRCARYGPSVNPRYRAIHRVPARCSPGGNSRSERCGWNRRRQSHWRTFPAYRPPSW